MEFVYKERCFTRFDRFPAHEQVLIVEADRQIRAYYATRQAPFGLRIKLLYATGRSKVFEARVSQPIRIVWVEHPDLVSFALVGSHEEVRRYLRSLR
jgi:hypothetical protein